MRQFRIHKRLLQFKKPAGTSRGTLHTKPAWYIELREGGRRGLGECGLLPGLSVDDRPDFESALRAGGESWCRGEELPKAHAWPSLRFGMETALASLNAQDPYRPFPSEFSEGALAIPINGLIWMGDAADMVRQAREKIASGFTCIKMKIGAIDFDSEIGVIREIRKDHPPEKIEIRVDANGAFAPEEALEKLEILASLGVHSIEQPIKAGQWEAMAQICRDTPLPIALDEELIGVSPAQAGEALLRKIRPSAIILKPGLLGGFATTDLWMDIARSLDIKWWITSALESNVGLNAIAQYTSLHKPKIAQGLGTGSLYLNNPTSPLFIDRGHIRFDPRGTWENPFPDASF